MRTGAFRTATLLALLLLSGRAGAWGWWDTLKTDDFTVFYAPGYEAEARTVLATLEARRSAVTPFTGSLALDVPVTIEDAGLLANGFADPVYYRIHIFTSPPFLKDMMPLESWLDTVTVHEYTHLSHMTASGGAPGTLAYLFGTAFSPNILSPMWFTEGLAVNAESSLSPHSGRLNDGFFDAYIRARARDGRLPSLEQASSAPLEFPSGTGFYLYGGEFLSWVADRPQGARFPLFVRTNGSRLLSYFSPVLPSLGVDRTARDVWGKRTSGLWKDWQAAVTAEAAGFAIDGEQVTRLGWFAGDLAFDGARIIYKRSYPVKTAAFGAFFFEEIVARDILTGRSEILVTTTSSFVSRNVLRGGKLWYGTAEYGTKYANTYLSTYGVETQVHERDLATGRDRVAAQGRFRAFTVLADGRLVLARDRRDGFGTELVAADPGNPQAPPRVLFVTDLLVDELVSEGNRIVATARADGECFGLFDVDLAAGKLRPLVQTPWLEGTPVLDGDRLYFAANYGKVYSIYRLDLPGGKLTRLTEGGFAVYPAPAGEWLYFVGLNSFGFDLYRKRAEPREARLPEGSSTPWTAPAPANVRRGGYADNLAAMARPALWSPVLDLEATTDGETMVRERYGIQVMGSDAVGDFPGYQLTLAYDRLGNRAAFDGQLSSGFFAPWQATLAGGNYDEKAATVSISRPLLVSLAPGINAVAAGLSVDAFDDFTRRQLTPYVAAQLAVPLARVEAFLLLPQERERWGSAADGNSLYLLMSVAQYLPGSQLTAGLLAVRNKGGVATTLTPPRGYRDELDSRGAVAASLDWTIPVWKMHFGMWNPTIYFEDLVAGAFVETLSPEREAPLSSGGLELHVETWVTNMALPLDWGGRVAVDRGGEVVGEAFIMGSVVAGGMRRAPREVRGAVRAARQNFVRRPYGDR